MKDGEVVRLLSLILRHEPERIGLTLDGQGHSLPVDLDLLVVQPPDRLWYGIARDNLDAIFREGLKPGRRQMVHLSDDRETTQRV